MKKILKSIMLFLGVILLSGCFNEMTPSEKVSEFLDKYVSNDKSIMDELASYMDSQNLTESQKSRYEKIVKDEYSKIKYEIKDESINGNVANIEVALTVKDLYKANQKAENCLVDNPDDFYTNGIYDQSKFIDYKLDTMEKSDETVSYTIYINLTKTDDIWTIDELDTANLEKIHGIYDYETDK